MAERVVIILLALMSAPFVWLAKVAEAWNVFGIRSDIEKCLAVVDSRRNLFLPSTVIVALIAAEDHRNALHPGVDPIAMLRALYVRCRFGAVQGASTIEQQFVRVVSGRYERTLARKAYEQALAVCVSRRRGKLNIANTYLAIAYYGSALVGIDGLRAGLGTDLWVSDIGRIREMIARLKYPEPLRPTAAWRMKIRARVVYIEQRVASLGGATPKREPARDLVDEPVSSRLQPGSRRRHRPYLRQPPAATDGRSFG